jgi:hypothetical protein
MYFPRVGHRHLREYEYFPSDSDTADVSSQGWWERILTALSEFSIGIGVDAVSSPVIYPNVWNDEYFAYCTEISEILTENLSGSSVRVLSSVLVDTSYLTEQETVLRTASILTGRDTSGYYLIFESDVNQRREFTDPNEIFGMLTLIHYLSTSGLPILVAHCSSDMVLFKAAGVSHCASGKFFNLRRFTKSRFRGPSEGGGQLSYWFEHSLMGFFREAELLRLIDEGQQQLLGNQFSGNMWAERIQENFISDSPQPWVALGWRQFLSWFGKCEAVLQSGDISTVNDWLRNAEDNWRILEDSGILMDDPRNDGQWLRPWRIALNRLARQINT